MERGSGFLRVFLRTRSGIELRSAGQDTLDIQIHSIPERKFARILADRPADIPRAFDKLYKTNQVSQSYIWRPIREELSRKGNECK